MSIRKTMFAAALAAFAFAALPAFASAHPVLDIQEGGSGHFTFSGGATVLTSSGASLTCTGVTGTGEFEGNPSTTGTIGFAFTGCKSSGTNCTSTGAAGGEIKVASKVFHLVTATDVTEGEPVDAMLITPENPDENGTGFFATFKCAFGLVHVEVKGTGIIGEIENWETLTNKATNTFSVDFAQHNGEDVQTYQTTEENPGKVFDLESKVGNNAWETTTVVQTLTATFTEGSNTALLTFPWVT